MIAIITNGIKATMPVSCCVFRLVFENFWKSLELMRLFCSIRNLVEGSTYARAYFIVCEMEAADSSGSVQGNAGRAKK